MREHVRDDAGQAAAIAASHAASAPRRAHAPSSKSCVQSVVGTSVMPPSSPFGGARAHEHAAVGAHARRKPRRGAAALSSSAPCAETLSGSPRARAAQASIQGQSAQAGFFGVQMVAPRSISACAKSPARAAGTSVCGEPLDRAAWPRAVRSSTANSLATTRSTLPSTGAAGASNAIAAIAAAV